MKIRQILEARAISRDTRTVYYYEYYPHYRGTLQDDGEIKFNDLDDLVHEVYNTKDSDAHYSEDLDKVLGMKQYAFYDIIREWPSIRDELIKNGHWVGDWEEGSHSLSLNSAEDAYDVLKKYEMAEHDSDDWNDDDWE